MKTLRLPRKRMHLSLECRLPHEIDNPALINPLTVPSTRPHNDTSDREREPEQGIDFIPAKDIIRIITEINGDDIRIEDFMKSSKRAEKSCNQHDLLLDFIIAEKIKGNAENIKQGATELT